MGNLYSKVQAGANLSPGAADTFAEIGSGATAPPGTTAFRGIIVSGCPAVETAAEAVIGQYKVSADSLLADSIFDGPPRRGGAASTNIGSNLAMCETWPIYAPMGVGEIVHNYGTFHLPAPTTGLDCYMANLFEGNTGFAIPDWVLSNSIGVVDPMTKCFKGEAKSAIVGTAEVEMTTIKLPATAQIASSISVACQSDAFEAVECIGFLKLETNFPNSSPWEYPIYSPAVNLGTAVGTGENTPFVCHMPCWMQLPGNYVPEITPKITFSDARATGSQTVAVSIGCR